MLFKELEMLLDGFAEMNVPGRGFRPAMAVNNSADKGLVLTLELPGVRAEDIDVSASNSVITISGTRDIYGATQSFRRSLAVPSGFDIDHATAAHDNGVFTLTIPTREVRKKVIEVQSSSSTPSQISTDSADQPA